MHVLRVLVPLALASSGFAQKIRDIYTTTWNQSLLFDYQAALPSPIRFVAATTIANATITVNDTAVQQPIDGFGATLTDTSSVTFLSLKVANETKYWELLRRLFDTSEPVNAGLSYLRVTIGASDLSPLPYDFDDVPGDVFLRYFNINSASNTFAVIRDIRRVNPSIKVHILPWSPPAWMKVGVNATFYGGNFSSEYINTYSQYLLKSLQGFTLATGGPPYAIGIQNEPENSNPTYPTCLVSPEQMGEIGLELRSLMDVTGFRKTKIVGFEHNWNDAGAYPVQLIENYGDAFTGVAFHCYSGGYKSQAQFTSVFPDREVYFTECTGTIGSDFWGDVKWWMDNLFVGAISYKARTVLMWNIAAKPSGGPLLPDTTSCGGGKTAGCRPIVNIANGSYSFNQEYYALAQNQRAVLPTTPFGAEGNLVSSSVGGNLSWALRTNAYVTPGGGKGRDRYSLVVLNWYDNASSPGGPNPIPVTTTINFRGLQANYTFPVGVTTLSWEAVSNDLEAHRYVDQQQLPFKYPTRFD